MAAEPLDVAGQRCVQEDSRWAFNGRECGGAGRVAGDDHAQLRAREGVGAGADGLVVILGEQDGRAPGHGEPPFLREAGPMIAVARKRAAAAWQGESVATVA